MALACRRNATAGKQLCEDDKRKMAVRLYNAGEGSTKEEIADILSITERTVNKYLEDIDEQLKKEREEKMLAMWLACYTQAEIAKAVGLAEGPVSEFLQKSSDLETIPKAKKCERR
jgi:DNA-binding CsgD family transcriptional regulator